ncbi:UNVERIFIED_ORG: hypothetical protein LHK14_23925 (plasmid) [Roseateles sp. XES5]|nr:hypothetical protein [Roseateles sp. XES5]
MRTKRASLLFSKSCHGTTAGSFLTFSDLPLKNDARPQEDKRRTVIETFDEIGVRRIQVVLLLSVVDDIAHILHDGVVTALCLNTITNAYNVHDGMPALGLATRERRFDA